MAADSFREQSLRVRQRKDLFDKSVKVSFAQSLCLRYNALNGSATGDEPVRPLAPISLFVVGSAVLKALDLVLLLRKLPLHLFFLGLLLFDFFFGNRQISRRMDTHGIIVVERFATFHYY